MSDKLPDYRARPAWVESEPPGDVLGARVQAFGFEGKFDAMDRTLDRYLNAGAVDGLVYRTVAPLVVVTFLKASLTSTSDPYGWLPDVECAVWMPVAAIQNGKVRGLYWFMPWVWVNSAAAMQTGYCVWGYAKSIGVCNIPADLKAKDARFEMSTYVYDTLSPNTEGVVRPLITLERHKETALEWLEHGLQDLSEFFSFAGRALKGWIGGKARPSLGLADEMFQDLIHKKIPIVNLKQFRDCAEPSRACYQSIVESTCTPSKVHLKSVPGAWRMKVLPYASHPLCEELGLAPGGAEAMFSAEVDMDFTADLGQEVWRAGAGVMPRAAHPDYRIGPEKPDSRREPPPPRTRR
ncbi:MAG: hypothetical protein GY716_08820 [bacterium]|nr:hypothetical protein [bacterium]